MLRGLAFGIYDECGPGLSAPKGVALSLIRLRAMIAYLTVLASYTMLEAIISFIRLREAIVYMKRQEQPLMSLGQIGEARLVGERIARLRRARHVLQAEAAVRAGISRPTATLIEAGDPGRTLGQVLRYLGAIAPGMSLLQLLSGEDPSVTALSAREKRQRVRQLSDKELRELDF